jgi:predicted nucleic acid-binding protein
MKNITALVDSNVILDSFFDREPFGKTAKQLLADCKSGQFDGFIAAHSFTNMFYIMRKEFSLQERKELLLDLCNFFGVIGIDEARIIKSLNDDTFDDIEDYLQFDCAEEANADYIITRDPRDFANSQIPVISPEAFLELTEKDENSTAVTQNQTEPEHDG